MRSVVGDFVRGAVKRAGEKHLTPQDHHRQLQQIKILGKGDISKENKTQKRKRKKYVWLSGRMHIEERRTI